MADSSNNEASKPANNNPENDYTPVPGASLFIGNLSFNTTPETLQTEFGKFGGNIIKITIPGTSRKLGYGFVHLDDPAAANKAKDALDNTELDGRTIHVELAKNAVAGPKRPRRRRRNNKRRGRGGAAGAAAAGGNDNAGGSTTTPAAPAANSQTVSPVVCGGMTGVRAVDDAATEIAKAVQADIEAKAGQKFEKFVPVAFATQVVAGVNYFFKIDVGSSFVHARVFQGFDKTRSVHSVQTGKTKTDNLDYF